MRRRLAFLFVFAGLTQAYLANAEQSADVVVGVDPPGVGQLSPDEKLKLLNALHQSGVRSIRAWIGNDSSYDFLKKAYDLGIKTDLTLYIMYRKDAPMRAPVSDMPWMYGGPPLSAADPDLTKSTFESQLKKLEDLGIQFVAFELGNEQNNPSFNPEFTLYPKNGCATCRNMGLNDLKNYPEGQKIAAGFRNYVKLLAAVKEVRDHSRLNRHTPILLGGLADTGGEGPAPGARTNWVTIKATIEYMRAYGLDDVVDGYGIHTYPWANAPGDPAAAANRRQRLEDFALSECRPQGQGKPCWITEWGFQNPDEACPVNDTTRALLVREFMTDLRPYVQQKRLLGLLYYDWERVPGAQHEDPNSIFRCGSLTPSGKIAIDASLLNTDAAKLALSPMGRHQKIVSQATGLCFNIKGNTNNSGGAIIPWPCGGFTNMEFNFVDQGSGFYSIHTVNATQDLCLNISTAALSPGDGKKDGGPGNLIQWSCSGSYDNELFKLVDLGRGRQQIRVKNSGLCLEDPGSGGTIRQNVCSSSSNQTFTLTE